MTSGRTLALLVIVVITLTPLAPAADFPLPPGVAVWLRSTDVATSGATVTEWTDLSGNNHHAPLFAGTPSLVGNAINGLPAVNFGGSGEYRFTGSIGLDDGFTVFIVGQELSPFNSNERALQIGNIATGANGNTVGIDINAAAGTGAAGTRYNNGNNLFSPGWNSDTSTYHLTTVAMPDASPYNSSTYALNGSPGTFVTSTNPGFTANFTGANDQGYTLGRGVSNTGGVSDAFSGRVAEVLIFNTVLTAQQQNDLNYYLAQRYNLPTSATIPAGLANSDIYFDNAAGTGSWHSGSNWDIAIQPTATNNTFINGGLTATLALPDAATNNLTVGSESTGGPNTPGIGTLNITGGSLDVSGTLRVGGDSNASRGTIQQSGGAVTVAGGMLFGGATSTAQNESLYRISGSGTLDVTGDIAHAPGAVRGHLYVDAPDALTVSRDILVQSFRTGNSTAGSHTVNPGQTLTTTGTLLVGNSATGQLTLLSTGNTADNMRVGEATGSAGSTLTLDGGAGLTAGQTIVGRNAQGGGTIHVIDGTLDVTSTLFLAGEGTGAGNTTGHLIVGDGVSNPTVTVTNNLEVGRGGAGQFTLNSGTVTVTNNNFVIAQTGGSASGQVTITGGTLNVGSPGGNNDFNVNSGTGGATIDHTGGTVFVARDLRLANNNATAGSRTYNLDGGTVNIGRHLRLGENGSATLNYESGTLNIGGVVFIGGSDATSGTANPDADGTLNIGVNGGTPTLTTGQFEVGRHRVGTVNQAAGTVNIESSGNLVISQFIESSGTYNISGGTLNLGVGAGSQGNMNFNSGEGTFNQTGGSVNLNGKNINMTNANHPSTYNLSGGVLDLGGGNLNGGPAINSFNFTGGTLKNVNAFNHDFHQQGGVLQIGPDATAGAMTVNGNYLFSSGTIDATLNGAATDLLTVTGGVTLSGGTLSGTWGGDNSNIFRGTYSPATMHWLLDNQGGAPISGTFANSTPAPGFAGLFDGVEPHLITIDDQLFAAFYTADFGAAGSGSFTSANLTSGHDILLLAVPEPSRALLLAAACAALLLPRRR